ncbi:GNAT family N-acetyltransferase [Halovulum sp. GXIMD14794]
MKPVFRTASRADIPDIVALLTEDDLGKGRESEDLLPYRMAFDAMRSEIGNSVIVGEADGRIVATYQLTLISGLSRGGARRAQIEAVRVASDLRGQGVGAALMQDAEDRAREAGCRLVQFTSDQQRTRAHEFYERLGYIPSHVGFKKPLD